MANKVRKDYVKHIFLKGKDVFDKPFEPYNRNKESRKYGERKRQNKFKRQATRFKNSTAPVLTGDFMNDCKPYSTQISFGVIWAAHGAKVKFLADKGRKVTDKVQPFPKDIMNMINRNVAREIKNNLPPDKVSRFKLGK